MRPLSCRADYVCHVFRFLYAPVFAAGFRMRFRERSSRPALVRGVPCCASREILSYLELSPASAVTSGRWRVLYFTVRSTQSKITVSVLSFRHTACCISHTPQLSACSARLSSCRSLPSDPCAEQSRVRCTAATLAELCMLSVTSVKLRRCRIDPFACGTKAQRSGRRARVKIWCIFILREVISCLR